MVCCAKGSKYLKKHLATTYRNMPTTCPWPSCRKPPRFFATQSAKNFKFSLTNVDTASSFRFLQVEISPLLKHQAAAAEWVVTHRLAPGTRLPTLCCDVNSPSHSQTHSQTTGIHCPSQAGALLSSVPRNCHSTSRVPETCGPPISTVHTYVLGPEPAVCARVTQYGPWVQGTLRFSTRLRSGWRP